MLWEPLLVLHNNLITVNICTWSTAAVNLFQRTPHGSWPLPASRKTSIFQSRRRSRVKPSAVSSLPPEAVISLSYTCGICGQQCSNQTGLQNHIYRSHKKADSKMFKCDQCDRSYMSQSKLKRHQREDHMGLFRHICLICKKGFSNRGGLQGHLVTHGAQAEFQCEVCQRLFAYKQGMKQHMAKEHGIKIWRCLDNILIAYGIHIIPP